MNKELTFLSILDFIARQVFSGRWILTVASAGILWHVAHQSPDKVDKIIDICKDVVIFYFVVKNTVDALPKNTQTTETKTTSTIPTTEVIKP